MGKLFILVLLTSVEFGHAIPVEMASASADPIFTGIAKPVAPRMGATLKSQTLQLLRGLEPGGNDRHTFWLTAPW